jgi:hypothetical protein
MTDEMGLLEVRTMVTPDVMMAAVLEGFYMLYPEYRRRPCLAYFFR